MNPYVLLAFALAWGTSLAGTGWYAMSLGEDKAIAKQVSDDQIRQQTRDAAMQGTAAAIAALKPVNQTIVQRVQREVQTNTVYADCRVPASGMQLANQAITGRPAEPANSGGMSSPDAAAR
ncbi:MAG: hypothetical protein J7605_02455 [Variovorax sp.]|nr:hypothetical protein [Variovorax sp.]